MGCDTTSTTTSTSPDTAHWNGRVGNYTYTQAVADLGTPLDTKQLADGGSMAEWITQRGVTGPAVQTTDGTIHTGGAESSVNQMVSQTPKNQYLRLTFDAGGKLTKWDQVYR
jgi:hypothetical protein